MMTKIIIRRSTQTIFLLGCLCISSRLLANQYSWQADIGTLYSAAVYESIAEPVQWYMIPVAIRYSQPSWKLQLSSTYLYTEQLPQEIRDRYHGMGDAIISATYLHQSPLRQHWWLDTSVKMKFPTANSLVSTGEHDYWLDINIFRFLQRSWFLNLGMGKKFRGSNKTWVLEDSLYFDANIGRIFNLKTSGGLILDYMQPSTTDRTNVIETTPYISYRLDPKNRLLLYFIKGLTDDSTDRGIGIQLTHSFAN